MAPTAGASRASPSRRSPPPACGSCSSEHPDERRARALLEPLHGWHRFLLDARDPHGLGEPVLIHPWESGRDNAVEWDAPLWRVMPEVAVGAPARHRLRGRRRAAEPRALPPLPHARAPGHRPRAGTSASSPGAARFRVLDAGFSAILARACLDLAEVAEQLGEARIAEESRPAGERVAAALRARAGSDGLIARGRRHRRARRCPSRAPGRRSPCSRPAWATSRSRPRAPPVLDGALASRYGVRSLDAAHPERSRAQLLARPGVGQHHLARRRSGSRSTASGAPRGRCASG